VYESNCQGNFEVYRGTLNYSQDKTNELAVAALISPANATRLTNNNTDDRFPRVSPDGSRIAFTANRDGNAEIYLMNVDGGQQQRITNSNGADDAPTWSPDGQRIVFNSNRDGDHEIYIMNRDGNSQVQLTNNGQDDGYAIFAQ
jgi:Tol biopolymer transport system component